MSPEPGGAETAEPALPLSVADGVPAARVSFWRVALDLLHDLAVAVLLCAFLIAFVAQAFRVQGTSMQPLLEDGERIIVNKLTYRFRAIERGDVVVFYYPRDPSVSFIKRVIGLPGDIVEKRGGVVYVNGNALDESYLDRRLDNSELLPPRLVEQGYYYVLGDHRNSSNDSRNWGLVPERYIYGQAFYRFWPLLRAGVIR